jgi:hypothetical protein
MKFSRGLFGEALHALSVNRPIAFTFLAAQLVLSFLEGKLGHTSSAGQLILFSILAICIHQAVIKENFGTPDLGQFSVVWSYGWRLIFMLIVSGLASYALTSLLPIPPEHINSFLVFFAIIMMTLYTLILSMWGTSLPAVAVAGNVTLSSATARGRATFVYSALRFAFCCGPILVAAFVLVFFLAGKLVEAFPSGTSGFKAGELVLTLIGSIIGLFNTALASTILSRAYLIGEARLKGASA